MINPNRKDNRWGSRLAPGAQLPRSTERVNPRDRYEELKTLIQTWWGARWKIGDALREIHTDKLYLREYKTFDDFCESEFGMNRNKAYRLMEFSEVRESVPNVQIRTRISNENQALALAKVPPQKREKVIKTVIAESGSLTAKGIREAAVIDVEPEPAKPVRHCPTCTCEAA